MKRKNRLPILPAPFPMNREGGAGKSPSLFIGRGMGWVTCVLIAFCLSFAENLLTVDDAVAIALKNNYDVRVARSSAEIDRVNNTLGNAGMLPALSAEGSRSYGESHSENTLAAGVTLSWTLFDGGKMFVTKSKLRRVEELGELKFRDQVQQTVAAVVAAYYDVVRQKQQLAAVSEVISLNRERVKLSDAGVQSGLSLKSNLLQAKIDLNVLLENALTQQTLISAAQRTLNQLLCRPPETPLEVSDSIPQDSVPDIARVQSSLASRNLTLLSYRKQVDIAAQTVTEYKTLHWPKLTLVAGYDYQQGDFGTGTVSHSLNYGPKVSGTLSVPLFAGGNTLRQVSAARLQLRIAEARLENVALQAARQLRDAFDQYDSQRKILAMEQENAALAKENLDIAMNRLRLGQSTSLELKQAEDSYMESKTRLVNFAYALKVSELKIRQLTAELNLPE